jgi:hypothetical protein
LGPSITEDCLEIILALLRQLEATLLGLKQLRGCIGQGVGQQMLELAIFGLGKSLYDALVLLLSGCGNWYSRIERTSSTGR